MSGSRSGCLCLVAVVLTSGHVALGQLPVRQVPSTAIIRQGRGDFNGDPLPLGATARLGTLRFRHEGTLFAIAFSPDGTTLATGGDKLLIWDIQTGKPIRQLVGHTSWISSL